MGMGEVVAIIAGATTGIGLGVFLLASRIGGSACSNRLPRLWPVRVSSHSFIKKQLYDAGRMVHWGRWCWDYNGDTYYAFAWMWWQVPARWSMRAFRIVLLDKQVNGA